MTIPVWLAPLLVSYIVASIGFKALTSWRLGRIEKMLGNGTPGVFPRREEVKLLIQEALKSD